MLRLASFAAVLLTALASVVPTAAPAQSSRDLLTLEVASCVTPGTVEAREVQRRAVIPTECPASRARLQTHFGLQQQVALGEEQTERDDLGNTVTRRRGPQVEVTVLPIAGTAQVRLKGRVRAGAEFYGAEEGWVEIDEIVHLGEGLYIGTWPSTDRERRRAERAPTGASTSQVERVWIAMVERTEAVAQR